MPGIYESIGKKLGQLVDKKNTAYGDSFKKSGEFLKLLYPNGVSPEQYQDMLGVVRVFDKLMRIATDKDAFGENPWNDIAGYGILKSNSDNGQNYKKRLEEFMAEVNPKPSLETIEKLRQQYIEARYKRSDSDGKEEEPSAREEV